MGNYHCWYLLRRNFCAAIAVAVAGLFVASTSVAEEIIQATMPDTATLVSEPLGVAETDTAILASEPLGIAKTDTSGDVAAFLVASAEGISGSPEALSLLAPEAGNTVNDIVVLPKTGKAYKAVLELTSNRKTIAPVVIVWERDFEYFLPVKDLARILRFPSNFDPASLRIEGEFFNPQNRYSIDVSNGTYSVLGEVFPLPDEAFMGGKDSDKSDGIYITIEMLNKIWPLNLKINTLTQTLSINSKRKLPFELELERKRRQEKLERQKREKEERDKFEDKYVYTPNGYKLLGPQTLFLSQKLNWNNNQKNLSNSFFISGQGDFLGTAASYGLNLAKTDTDPIGFEDFTIRLRRGDYKSGKLLPLGLKLIDAGDISVRTPSLVSGSLQGTGIYLSTDRNTQDIDFDEVTVQGSAEPGWDVEVYSRGVLIDYGVVDELGRYRFENVPLTFGNNVIKLIFYGPQGQIEEKIEKHSIARKFLRPGEMTYQAGIVKRGNRVIEVNDPQQNNVKAAKTFRVNRGINRYMSGFATFTDLPSNSDEKNERYLSLGANFNALGGWGQIEAYKRINKGTALDIRYAKDFMGFSTSLRSSVFRDLESKRSGTGANAKETETSLSITKMFTKSFLSLNLSSSLDRTTYKGIDTDIRLNTAQSLGLPVGNLSHTNSASWRGGKKISATGQLSYNTSLSDNFGINTKLSYEQFPKKQFNSLDTSLSYSDRDRLTASLSYGQSLLNANSRTASLGAAYDFDSFKGNVNFGWGSEKGLNFTLGTSTTLGPQGESNFYELRRKLVGQPTRLSVQLYEDLNNDGVYDPGDNPVPGAKVVLNGGKKSGFSDEEGYLDIAPAGGEGLTTITLDRKSLTYNPFLIPAKKDGHITILRAGTKPHIDFPLIMSGTIDGTVRDADGRGMPRMTIQLIDQYGQLSHETTTLFDGFYNFELVKPGRYIVQVHPSHRVFVPTRTVTVASEDLFAYGVDLQILKQAKEAPVVIETDGENGGVAHTYHAPATGGTELLVSKPSGGGVQPVVRAVRIGEHPHKVRLVLDLSEPTRYRITKDPNGSVITIELPNTAWEAATKLALNKHSIFSNFEIKSLADGGSQLRLTGRNKIDVFYNALLPSENGKSDRIYVDFTRVK